MYCTIADLKRILPATITIGDINIGTPSPGQPLTKRDKLTYADAIQYIRFAQQEIDSRLRPYYVMPLRRIKTFETEIIENVSPGSKVKIRVWDSSNFSKEDVVRLQNRDSMELSTVWEETALNAYAPADPRYVTIDHVQYSYPADESKISIVKFPDPISIICARFAVSYAFDQLFHAEHEPDISDYGVEQRKLALNSMDSILSGTVLLLGQDHTGRRFVRGSLMDAFDSPTKDFQFGREKGA